MYKQAVSFDYHWLLKLLTDAMFNLTAATALLQ
jgi:hypothetical protein